MIDRIIQISHISVIDKNSQGNLFSVQSIDFNQTPLGSGGFGSVYKVTSINDGLEERFVLKIIAEPAVQDHTYDTIRFLHSKIKQRQAKYQLPFYHDIRELLGLPFLAFKGKREIDGGPVVGLLMYDLNRLQFQDLGSNDFDRSQYGSNSPGDRLYYAYTLAKALHWMHSVDFIHADITEDALWYSNLTKQIALIDFDAGYHSEIQEKPITWSKPSLLAGYVWNRLSALVDRSKLDISTNDRIAEENLRIARGVFQLIAGFSPYFFLTSTDNKVITGYLRSSEWPEANTDSDYFNPANEMAYHGMVRMLQHLESHGFSELNSMFVRVFNKGFRNAKYRPTAMKWKELLFRYGASLDLKPVILEFVSDRKQVYSKDEVVTFRWKVTRFNRIYLDGQLMDIGVTTHSKTFQKESIVELRIENDFGSVGESIRILAEKRQPVPVYFEVSKEFRDSLDPVVVSWKFDLATEVVLVNTGERFDAEGTTELAPTEPTKYIFRAQGFFDEVWEREVQLDVVRPSIDRFMVDVNLEHGINNVDVLWKTSHAETVEIFPKLGVVDTEGLAHVNIYDETHFRIVAKGIFGSAEQQIEAHPFPVPVIKQLILEVPAIETKLQVDLSPLSLPSSLLEVNEMLLRNSLKIPEEMLDPKDLHLQMTYPEIPLHDDQIRKYGEEKISISTIYDQIKRIIHKKLKQYEPDEIH